MSRLIIIAAIPMMLDLSPPAHASKFKTLYHFKDGTDGGGLISGVVQDASGTIYGETYAGGSYICPNPPYTKQGCGVVYALSPTGALNLLVSFTGANGGHGNITPVLIGNTLYGATAAGGANNDGVIFSVNTDGTNFTIVHQFSGTDGTEPNALVADASGTLYGITKTGGTNHVGVLFSLTQSGTYTVLHNFALPVSGYPNALIIAANGTLAGSTFGGGKVSDACYAGCGTVYTYTPANQRFTTLGTYPSSGNQGYTPYVGSFGPGPTIYAANFDLSIFSLNRQAGYTTLALQNQYTLGAGANSGPAYAKNGVLYGVLEGGILTGAGVIYSVQNNTLQDIHAFSGGRGGSLPAAKPTITPSGTLIGTTKGGQCDECSTIWELSP